MKLKKCICLMTCSLVFLTGCAAGNEESELTGEEKELKAVRNWFEKDIYDEEEFTDLTDYQYYARTIGLEKDGLLSSDMWEVYYSDSININKGISGTAVYLIRLDPKKLLEVWSANSNMTAEEICGELGITGDDLYYNFGYTSNSVGYAKNHKENKVTYPEAEERIFGADNGENRQTVFSSHFLKVDVSGKYAVAYASTDDALEIKQRDLLGSITKPKTYHYSEFDVSEFTPAFYVNNVGIKRLTVLSVPNGRQNAEDDSVSLMFNMSPFSYGCTDDDRLDIFDDDPEEIPESVTAVSEDVPVEHSDTDTEAISDVPAEHLEETEGSGE